MKKKKKKRNSVKEIQMIHCWLYQMVGRVMWGNLSVEGLEKLEIKIMDVLRALCFGEEAPHRKEWFLK